MCNRSSRTKIIGNYAKETKDMTNWYKLPSLRGICQEHPESNLVLGKAHVVVYIKGWTVHLQYYMRMSTLWARNMSLHTYKYIVSSTVNVQTINEDTGWRKAGFFFFCMPATYVVHLKVCTMLVDYGYDTASCCGKKLRKESLFLE